MFVIFSSSYGEKGYYERSYMFQHEYYPCFTDVLNEAKKYSTFNRAQKELNKISQYNGLWDLKIKEIDEEGKIKTNDLKGK